MAGLKAAEQQKSKKRSASAPLESEMHKVHRLSTEGKPPRRAFSLSLVPAIEVSGCGSKTVNGIYKRDGEYKGTPKFSREGNGFEGNQGVFTICQEICGRWRIKFEYDSKVVSYYLSSYTGKKVLNPFQLEWDISNCGFYPLPTLTRLQK